jgi:hypothetical protein
MASKQIKDFTLSSVEPDDLVLVSREASGGSHEYRSVLAADLMQAPVEGGAPQAVFLVVGNPNGVVMTQGPAVGVSANGALWVRPVATPGNSGWINLVGA